MLNHEKSPLGYETITLGRLGPRGVDAGVDRIKVNELPRLVSDRVSQAAESGSLDETLAFYEKELDNFYPTLFDQKTMAGLKSLLQAGRGLPYEDRAAYSKQVKAFMAELKAGKRPAVSRTPSTFLTGQK